MTPQDARRIVRSTQCRIARLENAIAAYVTVDPEQLVGPKHARTLRGALKRAEKRQSARAPRELAMELATDQVCKRPLPANWR